MPGLSASQRVQLRPIGEGGDLPPLGIQSLRVHAVADHRGVPDRIARADRGDSEPRCEMLRGTRTLTLVLTLFGNWNGRGRPPAFQESGVSVAGCRRGFQLP